LITTHKLDLMIAASDFYDEFIPSAQWRQEIAQFCRRQARL